ncbi:MAG: peptidylprolyl isomerase [candidate division WOR-3 bacterium]|nr:peptidylprolyl isomerase [candidate division WOR-3 bacterium]
MNLILLIIFSTLADEITAIVDEQIILRSEVDEYVSYIMSDPGMLGNFSESEIRKDVIKGIISKKILIREAEKESIAVAREDILKRVEERIELVKQRFPSEADFYKALDAQGLSLDQLRRNYEDSIRTEFLMQQLVQKKLASKIMISPVMVKKFYEENKDSIAILPGKIKLAHILIPIRPSEDSLKKGFERAVEVYQLLMSGADFATVAQEFSEDESSAKKGGMLGKIRKGETIEEFERTVFTLKPGVISQPFPTRLGYHIVEILNKGTDWVLARQILIKVLPTKFDTIRSERLAMKIKELVKQGADFDSLAKIYSAVPEIDIGEFFIKQFMPPYDTIIAKLETNDVSEPILTPDGYHLLYAREKIPERLLSFEDLREQIYQYLYWQELRSLYMAYIEEIEKKTFIEIFD